MPAYYFPGTVMEVPGKDVFVALTKVEFQYCPVADMLPPAGSGIRITHDPFGMAVSPDGKKAVTLHNGC
ncbi:MAG: hypothetical protein IPG82_19500 [Saprospiraceae bacterium]|nr:hypothetical protein [Saprospiraceae bacterium]